MLNMEPIKKRRNSILKKKSSEEDTTTEIKARRISFSGKKSIREFIAGEEAETIWGTSYEESADDLKVSLSESGLVNVHAKRIQLRSRHIVCDPQKQQKQPKQQKHRTSLKKKVHIAENDKENLCVKSNPPPPVETAEEVTPLLPAVKIEQPLLKSPIKSELAVAKNEQNVSKIQKAMPPKKLVVDSSSLCSSTFDFINFSAQINKTITIEQSLDVSLNESELQMFKFRAPVTSTEISPNVLCRSILMSEDDVNIVKMVRKQQKEGKDIMKEQITDEEFNLIETKKRDTGVPEISKTNIEESNIKSQTDDMTSVIDGNGSKRKSERKPPSIVLDSTLNEMNSPMPKKAMHTLQCSSINLTSNAIGNSAHKKLNDRPTMYEPVEVDESFSCQKPSGVPTIHFDSLVVEESAVGMHSHFGTNALSHTIFDSKTTNESSSFPNTTASCLTDRPKNPLQIFNQQTTNLNENIEKVQNQKHSSNKPVSPQAKKKEGRRTILMNDDLDLCEIDDSQNVPPQITSQDTIKTNHRSNNFNQDLGVNESQGISDQLVTQRANRQTIHINQDLDLTKITTQVIPERPNRQTIHFNEEIEISKINYQEELSRHISPRDSTKTNRQSNYLDCDLIVDECQENGAQLVPQKVNRPTIHINQDIDLSEITTEVIQKRPNRQTINFNEEIDVSGNYYQEEISRQIPSGHSTKTNRRTKHFNQDLDVDESQEIGAHIVPQKPNSQTIYIDQDLDLSEKECLEKRSRQTSPSRDSTKTNRQTNHLNPKLFVDERQEIGAQLVPQRPNRQTIHINQDLDLSKITTQVIPERPNRQTINFNEEIDVSKNDYQEELSRQIPSRYSTKTNRRTKHFNQDLDVDESQEIGAQLVPQKPNRQTIHINQDLDLSKITTQVIPQRPNQQTIHFNEEIDVSGNDYQEEISRQIPSRYSTKTNRRTKHFNQDLDVDESQEICAQLVPQMSNRQAIHIYQDLDLSEKECLQKLSSHTSPSRDSTKTNRQTNHFNPELFIDSKTVNECSSFPNTIASCLADRPNKDPLQIFNQQTTNLNTNIKKVLNQQHSSNKPVLLQAKKKEGRRTILMNDDLDLCEIDDPQNVPPQITSQDTIKTNQRSNNFNQDLGVKESQSIGAQLVPQRVNRQTIHINQDLDLSKITTQVIPQRPSRQTIHFNEEIDVSGNDYQEEISRQIPSRHSTKTNRRTKHFNQDLDVDESQEIGAHIVPQKPNSQTIYIDQDLDLSEKECLEKRSRHTSPSSDSTKTNRQTNHLNPKLFVDERQEIGAQLVPQRPNRQTIHINQDLDLSKITTQVIPERPNRQTINFNEEIDVSKNDYQEELSRQIPSRYSTKTNRRTKHFNQDLDVDESQEIGAQLVPQKPNRQTIHINQDLDLSKITTQVIPQRPNQQTIHFNEEIDVSGNDYQEEISRQIPSRYSTKTNRRTKHFNQDLDVDESQEICAQLVPQMSNRQAIHIYQDLDLSEKECLQKLSSHTSPSRDSTKTNRQTNHFNPELFIDSKTVNECSSFPNTIASCLADRPNKDPLQIFNQQTTNLNTNIKKVLNQQHSSNKPVSLQAKKKEGRRTILMNEDLDLCEIYDPQNVPPQITSQDTIKTNQRSNNFNQDLGVNESQSIGAQLVPQRVNRQTIHINQDFDLSKITTQVIPERPNRQTINFNEEIDVSKNDYQEELSSQIPSRYSTKTNRRTTHSNQDLDVDESQKIGTQLAAQMSNCQTIHIDQDLDLSEKDCLQKLSRHTSPRKSTKTNRQTNHLNPELFVDARQQIGAPLVPQRPNRHTIHINQDLDLSEITTQVIPQRPNRQTINFNEEIDVSKNDYQEELSSQIPSRYSTKTNRRTTHFNQDLDVDESQEIGTQLAAQMSNGQTIHIDQDLDLSKKDCLQKLSRHTSPRDSTKTNRQTNHLNPELFVDARQEIDAPLVPQRPNRQTIHINQDLDLSEITTQVIPQRPNRQTINFNEEIDVSKNDYQEELSSQIPSRYSTKTNRRTTHFNQDLDVDESQEIGTQLAAQMSNGQTIHIDQDLDLSEKDCLQKLSRRSSPRDSTKTNRQTNHLNPELFVDEYQEIGAQLVIQVLNRQTINFNQEIDLSENDDQLISSNKPASLQAEKKEGRRTILMNDDLDLCEIDDSQNVPPQITSQYTIKTNHRSNNFNQDLGVNESQGISDQLVPQRANRQTIHINQDLDLTKITTQVIPERPNHQTFHFNEEIEVSKNYYQDELSRPISPRDSTKTNGQTNYLNRDLVVDECQEIGAQRIHFHQENDLSKKDDQQLSPNKPVSPQAKKKECRKTIIINDDLDLCDMDDLQNVPPQITSQDTIKTNQRDNNFNQNLGVNESQGIGAQLVSQRLNSQTIHFNQEIDLSENDDQIHSSNQPVSLQAKKKQGRTTTLLNNKLDLCENDDLQNVPQQITSPDTKTNQQSNNCNQYLSVNENQDIIRNGAQLVPQRANRQAIHITQDLDLSEITTQVIPQKPNRQTIHFNEEIDVSKNDYQEELSRQIPSRYSTKPNRQTKHFNQDLDVDESSHEIGAQLVPQRPNCQTIHIYQDLELFEKDCLQKLSRYNSPRDSTKTNRQTNNLNPELFVDERQKIGAQLVPHRVNRETIHINQDLELSKITTQVIPERSNGQTIHFKEEIDVSENGYQEELSSQIPSRYSTKTNRRTNHLNQDLDVDERQEMRVQIIPPDIPTSHFDQEGNDHQHYHDKKHLTTHQRQELDMSISPGEQTIAPKKVQNVKQRSQDIARQTIYFQQDLEIEDQDKTIKQKLRPDHKGTKLPFHQEIEFEDQDVSRKIHFDDETKKNTEENTCNSNLDRKLGNFNNKPEFKNTRDCQTINFTNKNNSLEESFHVAQDANTMNRSVSKRNSLEKDEKGISAKLISKPRRVAICDPHLLDMDESMSSKCTARKSSFSRTLNFDEVHQNSKSVAKPKVTWQSSLKDDESPIYNPSLRAKCPMTPEVDRSLAEYLKVEAATEDQEDEIFYDAEDGTENEKHNKRQTCHVPVNILEESGMQPLPSLPLTRQTTFSLKEMTNDSIDHGISKLAATETNNEKNASHNCMQKQTLYSSFKNLFPKSVKSIDTMEVILTHDTTNNKQNLIDARPGLSFVGNRSITNLRNRQTLHFNESLNIVDVSTPWKPSSSVQNLKELLLENTRLFSQSNLLKPNAFEKKRSTMFFGENDDSMEVSCIDSSPTDPESTPTKNKISRIPQLIGSAKKLDSLKKSMEFIQQKLPNIACHVRNEDTYKDIDETEKDQEYPKELQVLEESIDSIEMCRKPQTVESPQKVFKNLQESFDTIDIPRKVVRKTAEESPRKDAIELEKPYNADESPPRAFSVVPTELQESFDTVDIPRRVTTFHRNDTLYNYPIERETTINASQKSLFQFEDPPITISDVSTFFSQNLLPNARHTTKTNSPNTTKALCKMDVDKIQALSRSPDSEDTVHNLAQFNKRYVDLTCDSITLSDSGNNIEKTHLSLVNTFEDESEMLHVSTENQRPVEISSPAAVQPQKLNSSVCKKCKCKRLSLTQNDTTIGSFMLEPLPVYKLDLSELEQLAKKPNISDVGKAWLQKIRESDSFNISDGCQSMAMDDEDSESIENFVKKLADKRLENAQYREQKRKETRIENSFVYKVRRKMQSKPNWIISDLLIYNNVILLTHTRIRTFAIIINFTPKDPRGVEVIFNDINFKPNKFHTRQWKPFEYALHYQLLVELPFDLKQICPTSENFFDFLEHVEKVTEDVLRTGKEMLSIILSSPASLIREPSGRLYIRKYVRTKTPQNDVKNTEINIEVRNIKKLSYESIAMPPLYEFDENIQLLPLGNDFLRSFLNDSLRFIKT